jgi:hypothetical protein
MLKFSSKNFISNRSYCVNSLRDTITKPIIIPTTITWLPLASLILYHLFDVTWKINSIGSVVFLNILNKTIPCASVNYRWIYDIITLDLIFPEPPSDWCEIFVFQFHLAFARKIYFLIDMSRVFSSNKGIRRYGIQFPENMDDLGIELYCYAISRGEYGKDYCIKQNINLSDFKLLSPHEHFINAVKLQWPTEVSIYNRGYTNTQLLRTLEELCNNTDICLAGAASMGKSFPVGLWVYLDWCSAPHCTSSWVATTTLGASEDRIWGIISKLWKCARVQFGKLIDYRHMIVWGGAAGDEDKDYRNAIKALAFQSGNEGQKAIDTTRGRKNDRVRLALDELPEMELGAITAKVNLSANNDITFIGIGNPSAGDNPHTRWAIPKDQSNFDSVSPDMDKWETGTGVCLFYNGMRSPNFAAPASEPSPFPFLMDRKKQEIMLKQCYGDENAIDYVRNAIGWWPKSGFAQTIITADLIRNADTNEEPIWDSEGFTKVAGFDTSFTIGGDRCVLTIAKLGFVRGTRNRVMWLESQKVIQLSANAAAEFEIQLATEVVALCRAAGVQPQKFGMDVSGDGGRVGQAIIREWLRFDSTGVSIALISSMGKPTDRLAAEVDKRPCKDVYDRLVSEYYYSCYHAFKSRVIFGVDAASELARELCLRRYTIKNKKIAIETKDDLKGRTGYSPDLSDSLIYALEMARRNGLVFIGNDKPVPTNRFWAREEKLADVSQDDDYGSDDNGDW